MSLRREVAELDRAASRLTMFGFAPGGEFDWAPDGEGGAAAGLGDCRVHVTPWKSGRWLVAVFVPGEPRARLALKKNEADARAAAEKALRGCARGRE